MRKLIASGLKLEEAQEAIFQTGQKKPKKPEPYILAILKKIVTQTQEAQKTQKELADWEKEWLADVKRRTSV